MALPSSYVALEQGAHRLQLDGYDTRADRAPHVEMAFRMFSLTYKIDTARRQLINSVVVLRGLGLCADNGVLLLRRIFHLHRRQHHLPLPSTCQVNEFVPHWPIRVLLIVALSSTAEKIRTLPGYGMVVAASRSLGARQVYIPFIRYYSPPLSSVAMVWVMIVFFCRACSFI